MARPKKNPLEAPPEDFKPSPMPTPLEVSTIAAALLSTGGKTPETIRGAVDAALALWGAALARTTERAIETARLEHNLNRAAGQQRWNEWQQRHLGIREQVLEWEKMEAEWKARGKEVFKGLEWPASFDDVMRRVMDGSVMDGKEVERHSVFSKVWVATYLPGETARRAAEWERRKPLIGDIVHEFAGKHSMPEMEAKHAEAIAECQRCADAACEATFGDLEKAAARMRTENQTFEEAIRLLRIWREHSRSEQNRKNARKRKKNTKTSKKSLD